jgi:hypothetical protein
MRRHGSDRTRFAGLPLTGASRLLVGYRFSPSGPQNGSQTRVRGLQAAKTLGVEDLAPIAPFREESSRRLNPQPNPKTKRKAPLPGFSPESRAIRAFVSTPTGNGTRLGIAWHPLAGRARRCSTCTECHSLRCLSSDSQPSAEPSSEPWLKCRPGGPPSPLPWGEPPKPTRYV